MMDIVKEIQSQVQSRLFWDFFNLRQIATSIWKHF
jgi:hypothetical protein